MRCAPAARAFPPVRVALWRWERQTILGRGRRSSVSEGATSGLAGRREVGGPQEAGENAAPALMNTPAGTSDVTAIAGAR